MTTQSTAELLKILKGLFDIKYRGADRAAYARAQGMADGYMRALLDLGLVTDAELLSLVNRAHRKAMARADTDVLQPQAGQAAVLDFV